MVKALVPDAKPTKRSVKHAQACGDFSHGKRISALLLVRVPPNTGASRWICTTTLGPVPWAAVLLTTRPTSLILGYLAHLLMCHK